MHCSKRSTWRYLIRNKNLSVELHTASIECLIDRVVLKFQDPFSPHMRKPVSWPIAQKVPFLPIGRITSSNLSSITERGSLVVIQIQWDAISSPLLANQSTSCIMTRPSWLRMLVSLACRAIWIDRNSVLNTNYASAGRYFYFSKI